MKKLFLSLAIASFLWVSCDNQEAANQEQQSEQVADATPVVIDIDKFEEMADGLADKLVEVKGTCMHTCKHGGTKMFIQGNNEDFSLKVTATDESGNFNLEMEGSDFVVVGILDEYRMDMAELDKMEADVLTEYGKDDRADVEDFKHKANEAEGNEHADHPGEEHAADQQEAQEEEHVTVGSCASELLEIDQLRAQAKENGKGYISYYSILAKTYKEIK